MNEGKVKYYKEHYKKDDLVELYEMEGEDMPYKLQGKVDFVDDIGQIHVSWENGSSLAINPEVDSFAKLKEQINVLVVEPNKVPYQKSINNELKEFQKIVGGYIEIVSLDESVDLICNDEGKLMGLEGNRRVGNDIIAGSFLLVSHDDQGNCTSLTDQQIEEYSSRFEQTEQFEQSEVEDLLSCDFMEMR